MAYFLFQLLFLKVQRKSLHGFLDFTFFFLTILRTKNNCALRPKEQWQLCLFFFKSALLFLLCACTAFLISFQSFLCCKMFVANWGAEITSIYCKYIGSFIYLISTGTKCQVILPLSDETQETHGVFKLNSMCTRHLWKVVIVRVSRTTVKFEEPVAELEVLTILLHTWLGLEA